MIVSILELLGYYSEGYRSKLADSDIVGAACCSSKGGLGYPMYNPHHNLQKGSTKKGLIPEFF